MSTWTKYQKVNLVKLFRSSNSNSFKALIVLDNIHDFGHDRKTTSKQPDYHPHNMDKYCDPTNYNKKYSCILMILLKTLNKYTNAAIGVPDLFTPDFFVAGWETAYRDLLLKEGDIVIPVNRSDFWNTIYVLPCFTKDFPIKSAKSITDDFIKKTGAKQKYLTTAHFDGCGGTCTLFGNITDPKGHPPPNFIFSIPTTIGEVLYKYDNSEQSLYRKFPKKYGKGTSYDEQSDVNSKKRCICSAGDGTVDCVNVGGVDKCFYNRVDRLSSDMYQMDPDVQDTLYDTAENMYKYLDYKYSQDPNWTVTYNDIKFFVTLKALGDLGQIVEAKLRGCYLFTGDKMQFILGAKMGAMMIDTIAKPRSKIYFSKQGALRYVTYLGLALKKSGVDVEGKSVEEMKGSLQYLKSKAGRCLQCVLKLLIYFAVTFGLYFTTTVTHLHKD